MVPSVSWLMWGFWKSLHLLELAVGVDLNQERLHGAETVTVDIAVLEVEEVGADSIVRIDLLQAVDPRLLLLNGERHESGPHALGRVESEGRKIDVEGVDLIGRDGGIIHLSLKEEGVLL